MILAIDVGNTNIVIGTIDNGVIGETVRIRTVRDATWAEHAIRLRELVNLSGIDISELEGAVIASVVPQVTEKLVVAIKKVTGLDSLVVGPGVKTGMNIRIDDPSTLGADFVVGCVGAMKYYGTPAIVLDLGTATTVVVVDKEGSFRGGAIFPGVNLSFSALTAGTSLLPDISITAPEKVISSNTVDCMRSGAVYGTASMLDGLIDRMEAELGEKCIAVATGGVAHCIIPYCTHDIILDDDLLLKGIWVIWEKNKG